LSPAIGKRVLLPRIAKAPPNRHLAVTTGGK
jgi:hypothetical protein